MVDIDAIAVYDSGEIQYYILYLSSESFNDTSIIQMLMTDNSNYSTAEGIHVGTSIKEAEQLYDKASLSYNVKNES